MSDNNETLRLQNANQGLKALSFVSVLGAVTAAVLMVKKHERNEDLAREIRRAQEEAKQAEDLARRELRQTQDEARRTKELLQQAKELLAANMQERDDERSRIANRTSREALLEAHREAHRQEDNMRHFAIRLHGEREAQKAEDELVERLIKNQLYGDNVTPTVSGNGTRKEV